MLRRETGNFGMAFAGLKDADYLFLIECYKTATTFKLLLQILNCLI